MSTSNPTLLKIQVQGEDPLSAVPPLFSNFLAISRAGTDVQFEFIFLDINQIASMFKENAVPTGPISGKTVSKVVMPAASVLQLKDHLVTLLQAIETDQARKAEDQNVGSSRASSR
ncbi:MAG TPA: hypothetical protein VFB23_05690 [Candidatus Acidoferrales bacterium]|nr:hypothetical protein [Candidatus Acidoferrales bacterium]